MPGTTTAVDYVRLAQDIKRWAKQLGFHDVGVADPMLADDERRLLDWLGKGRHGEMRYMAKHGLKRSRPERLVPGTLRVVCVRMDYAPPALLGAPAVLADPRLAYVSRYALGRDYHKVVRHRLQKLAAQIEQRVGSFGYRAFVDSAPVLEKALARNAGLGWIGKHTNLLARDGSWFFLGELFTDLPLPVDHATGNHCGRCRSCIDACPTGAIVAPYELDARLCISYLTIELRGPIPVSLRPLIGNRIFGCDDCQIVCPWNRFSVASSEREFQTRHGLEAPMLVTLFDWSESEFLRFSEGSAIRRIGYECWLRNVAVALGNGPPSSEAIDALRRRINHPSALVVEHVQWALARLTGRANATPEKIKEQR